MTRASDEYWNAALETMPPAQLRTLEDERLRQQLAYTWTASPFYRHKWAEAGVAPQQVHGVDDLALLPFTEKLEFQETQEADPPLGGNQCAPLERLIRMQATGGTTGRPLRMGLTRHDVAVYNELGARSAWAAGLRPGDVLFECMNYSLYAGGVSDHMTFETVGACVAPVGIGQSQRLIEILRDIRQDTCLYSTPSYALHLARVAQSDGVEPATLGVRKGLFSGEAGLAIPSYRQEIEQTWHMMARDIYGLGELGGFAAECRHSTGLLHYLGHGTLIAEFIDAQTGAVTALTEGAVGELVYTTIDREAHPMIRFRAHDLVRLSLEPCACGRTGVRFQVLGRSDDMFIVKGINVYPLGIQDVITSLRPHVTGEFQIVLTEPPPITYNPLLRVEYGEGIAPADLEALRGRLARRIRDIFVFTPEVELLPPGSLPRTERKSKRLFRLYQGDHLP